MAAVAAFGSGGGGDHSTNDITPFFALPMKIGGDEKEYVDTKARVGIAKAIASSAVSVPSALGPPLPGITASLLARATAGENPVHLSTRSRLDNFQSNADYTLTYNTGASHGARPSSATPAPKSPTRELLPYRHERTHQSAYRFTGLPGTTVHAPTQANQANDTVHENRVATTVGGFIMRVDTYRHSSMFSALPEGGGGYSVQHSSYARRVAPAAAASSAGAASTGASSSSASPKLPPPPPTGTP